MTATVTSRVCFCLAIGFTVAAFLFAAEDRTIRDGVYTAAQAERGKAVYTLHCELCHGENLAGGSDGCDPVPALRHAGFAANRNDLNNLYTYIRTSMPRDEPGTLDGRAVVDVIAWLLQQNSFPAGPEELPPDPDVLKHISTAK